MSHDSNATRPDKADEPARLRLLIGALTEITRERLPADALMARIVERAQALTGATGAVVELVDGEQLVYRVASGSIAAHRGLRLSIRGSFSGLCVGSREAQICADSETDPRVDRAACRKVGARAMLAVPLFHGDQALGVLKVVSDQPDAFDALDRQALQLSAGIIGAALGRQFADEENQRLLAERTAALAAARIERQHLQALIAAAPVAIVVHELDGRVRSWNPAAEQLFGWRADEVIGRQPPHVDADELGSFAEFIERLQREGRAVFDHVRRLRRDGRVVEARIASVLLRDADDRPDGILRTIEDTTAQREHEAALRAGAERLRRIIEHSHDAFLEMDSGGIVREWNGSAETLFGWTREQALGRPLAELVVPPERRAAFRVAITRYLSTGRSELIGRRIELPAQRRDGSRLAVEVLVDANRINGDLTFDAFVHDVSERRAEMESLRQRAMHDPLTGLPNRALLEERLSRAIARHRGHPNRLALMFVDLDGFKAINDGYGHEAGDRVLVETARRLAASVREGDTVARLAGDEFVVVLDGMRDAADNAAQVARTILEGLAAPVPVGDKAVAVHASIGIAVHDGGAVSVEALTRRADQAMYRAKQSGGDGYRTAAVA